MNRLVLASTSPARLTLLRAGGIEPITIAPHVDEDEVAAVAASSGLIKGTDDMVRILAEAKARAVLKNPAAVNSIVLGCDSSLEFEGESLGKPHLPEVAIERWKKLRGNSGFLYSGHCLIDNRDPENIREVCRVTKTKVHFAQLTDSEIEAYVATGEPLKVAGAFTVDGLGGAFISRIEGDYHTVVGLSLPILREMTLELGLEYTDFWN
jgi:septum formation protein